MKDDVERREIAQPGALVETQHPDHHRRHEMRAADLLLFDQLEGSGRVELPHNPQGRPIAEIEERKAADGCVVRRPGDEVNALAGHGDVVAGVALHGEHLVECSGDGPLHAFGVAGRPRRVGETRPRRSIERERRGVTLGDHRHVRLAEADRRDVVRGEVGEVVLGEDHRQIGVAGDIRHLARCEQAVDRHEPDAREHRCEVELEELGSVLGERADMTTNGHAGGVHGPAESSCPVEEFGEGDRRPEVVDQGGTFGVDERDVDGHQPPVVDQCQGSLGRL